MPTPSRRWPLRPPPEELQRRYLASGHWLDTTLGAFVDERLRATSGLELRIWSRTRPWRGTIGDVREMARHVAGGLRDAGIGPGDVVAFQLPNWIEAAATFYGASASRPSTMRSGSSCTAKYGTSGPSSARSSKPGRPHISSAP